MKHYQLHIKVFSLIYISNNRQYFIVQNNQKIRDRYIHRHIHTTIENAGAPAAKAAPMVKKAALTIMVNRLPNLSMTIPVNKYQYLLATTTFHHRLIFE
jgi:hypothetical protein